jgi:DNA polymerase III epsilon subunit-like protein
MSAPPIRAGRFAFVDVETTGIDPNKCAVVEVACQIVDAGEVVATFESLVNPLRGIPPFVQAIHGIHDGMVWGQPHMRELVPTLRRLCRGAVIVAHNADFDRRFLPFLAAQPSACSWRLASLVVPEAPNHKNQTLGNFFSVDDPQLDGRRPHRALADVIVTRHVFFHCIERYVAAGNGDSLEALFDFLQPKYLRDQPA